MEGIRVFIDGASQPNPGKMGIGIVIEWQNKNPLIVSEYAGEGTNNIAEYKALNRALELVENHMIKSVKILSDSNLVVNQTKKIKPWKCNDLKLIPLRDYALNKIKELEKNGFSINIEHIPREINVADIPAKNGCNKGANI